MKSAVGEPAPSAEIPATMRAVVFSGLGEFAAADRARGPCTRAKLDGLRE